MTTESDTTSNLDQVQDLQIRLSEVISIARLGDERFGDDADIGGPFCIIERELDSISSELDGVIRNGAINRSRLADAINSVVAMSEQEMDDVIDGVLGVLNRTDAYSIPEPEISALADQAHKDIRDANELLDTHDLDKQPGAAEKLPFIAGTGRALSKALSDLCTVPVRSSSEVSSNGTEDEGKRKSGNGPSGGTAYDDLTLTLEHAETLVQAIVDVAESGEVRNLTNLGALLRREIATADSICTANSKQWGEAWSEGGAE